MAASWVEYSPGVFGNPELSKQGRHVASKQVRLTEAAEAAAEFNIGTKSGDRISIRITGRITNNATAALGEFQKIPFGKPPTFEVTAQVYRRGFAVAYTSTLVELDRLNVEDSLVRALSIHAAETHNTVVNTRLVAGRSFTFVPNGAATHAWLTDGTVAASKSVAFTAYHLRKLQLEMKRVNMPHADGENYWGYVSPRMESELITDTASNGFIDTMKYASGGAEGIMDGEIGKTGKIRWVMDNHAIDDAIGAGTAFGSGFILGYEALKEVMGPYPMHFRANMNLGGDFGMQQGLAWLSFQDYKVPWDYATHAQAALVHATSA